MKTTVNKISTKKNDMYEHKCAHSSCDKIGEFKAPVSRESINEYIYFCLDHIREYNKNWNYYEGLNNEEIESEIRKATTWERPTWPMKDGVKKNWGDVNFEFHDFDNLNNKEIEKKVANYSLKEVKAFKIFNIPPTKNTEIIKKTYKKLVKKYHPDYNMGNKEYENKIKEINQAYNDIKDIK